MKLDAVIIQLRNQTIPVFNRRIHGAAELAQITTSGKTALPVPAAYVIPLIDIAKDNSDLTGFQQDVTEQFAVILALNNQSDRTGLIASNEVHITRSAIFKAILNWSPDPDEYDPIEYAGGQFLDMNPAILYWRLTFQTATRLTANDGFTDTYQDLNDVKVGIDMAEPSLPGGGPDGQIDAYADVTLDT
jgi:hypothetical protein